MVAVLQSESTHHNPSYLVFIQPKRHNYPYILHKNRGLRMEDYKDDQGTTDGAAGDGGAPSHKRLNMHDMSAIRRAMSRVYRDMRNGVLVTADGMRLAQVLNLIANLHERSELEARITALEGKQP